MLRQKISYICSEFLGMEEKMYKDIKISDFTYDLPDERIAKYPLAQRDKSKLLTWKDGKIGEDIFENCTHHLPENAQLVFNNTRVIHARLFFRKETGAKIEIFCLEPIILPIIKLLFSSAKG